MSPYPIQRAEAGGEAGLSEADARAFAALPLDVKARISKLPPELRSSAIRMYPGEERDRELREAELARKAKEREAKRRNQLVICREVLDGKRGREAQSKAFAILNRHGVDTKSFDVEKFGGTTVLAIVEVAVWEARNAAKRGRRK